MSAAVLLVAILVTRASTADKQPIIVMHGNTIVAFFQPMSDSEMDKDAGANEALADFQYYAARVREPLKKAGIDFQEVYAHSFRLRTGKSLITFRPSKIEVGYYFIAPGKKPRIEYGVMTDVDLINTADKYFGISIR